MTLLAAAPGGLRAADFDPLRDGCINTPMPRVPAPAVRAGHAEWQSLQSFEEGRGLVYRNLEAAGQNFLRAFYIAFFELEFTRGDTGETAIRRVRYCSGDDDRSDGTFDPATAVYRISYTRHIREPIINGDFIVKYRTRYGGLDRPCAGRHGLGESAFQRRCAMWVPAVDYEWKGLPDGDPFAQVTLTSVTAFFRLDYGKVGLTLVSDPDGNAQSALFGPGLFPVVLTETSFTAVDHGKKGKYDNIHTVFPIDGRRTVVVPGCRSYAFDCFHMHFRWGDASVPPLDPLIDPSTMDSLDHETPGTVYLAHGQTIVVAVTADKGEGDVDDPLALVDGDTLATAKSCPVPFFPNNSMPLITQNVKLESVVNPVVVWYMARSERTQDSFFRHGLFGVEAMQQPKAPMAVADLGVELLRQGCDPILEISGATAKKATP